MRMIALAVIRYGLNKGRVAMSPVTQKLSVHADMHCLAIVEVATLARVASFSSGVRSADELGLSRRMPTDACQ
jgi:hypothetical protein